MVSVLSKPIMPVAMVISAFVLLFGCESAEERLYKAIDAGDAEAVTALAAEVDLNAADSARVSPLFAALQAGNDSIAVKLLQLGFDPDTLVPGSMSYLHVAAKEGLAGAVSCIVAAGAETDATMPGEVTPLHLATRYGHEEAARSLIEAGAACTARVVMEPSFDGFNALAMAVVDNMYGSGPDAIARSAGRRSIRSIVELLERDFVSMDENGQTPLHYAAARGMQSLVQLMLDKGVDPNVIGNRGCTPVFEAVDNNDTAMARMLLERGADIDFRNKFGAAPLSYAVWHSDVQPWVLSWLIANGAAVDFADNDGETPLYSVAQRGALEKAALLLEAGADPDSRCGTRRPLHAAADDHMAGMVELLLANGATVHAKSSDGWTALHYALRGSVDADDTSRAPVVRMLLEKGANPNARNRFGATPLHFAAGMNDLEIVRLLIDRGARVTAKDSDGSTPLHEAITNFELTANGYRHRVEIVELLIQKKADVNARTKSGVTPLYEGNGTEYDNLAALQLLLDHGARVNSKTSWGETALHHAAEWSRTPAVKQLLEHGASPTITDNRGRTPLDLAVRPEVKRLLLEAMGPRGGQTS